MIQFEYYCRNLHQRSIKNRISTQIHADTLGGAPATEISLSAEEEEKDADICEYGTMCIC